MFIINWFKNLFKKQVEVKPMPILPPAVVIPEPSFPELPDADDKGMVHLGIVVGHTSDAPGACLAKPYGTSEYVYNTIVAKKMQGYAQSVYGKAVKVTVFFRDIGGIAEAYGGAILQGCDVVIELHFNAFNSVVTGTETLCTPATEDVDFAHVIQRGMCQVFGREAMSRGVKALSRSDRGGWSVHSFPVGPNCLVEPFFGDTPSEAKLAMDKQEEYSRMLVDSVVLWARKKDLIK